mmetsp:Transcript_42613/g.134162  ORF Transcript_42613/g.134162 Transcript_42613/m.134162 type:complete len:203 (+) Transcript_42613:974-1582(+)
MAKHADLHKKTITCPVCSTNLNLRQLEHAHASPHMKSSHLNSISSLDDHLDDGLYPKCYQITDGKSHSNFDEDEIDSSVDTSTSSCPEEQSFLTSSYIASPNLKSDGICAEVGFLDNSIFTPYKQKRFIEIKSPPSARSQEGIYRRVLHARNCQQSIRFSTDGTKQEFHDTCRGEQNLTNVHGKFRVAGSDENNNPSAILFM